MFQNIQVMIEILNSPEGNSCEILEVMAIAIRT